jgi:hypothetical protein
VIRRACDVEKPVQHSAALTPGAWLARSSQGSVRSFLNSSIKFPRSRHKKCAERSWNPESGRNLTIVTKIAINGFGGIGRMLFRAGGIAVRVPTANVSLVDLTAMLEKDADEKAIKAAMKRAADNELKGILEYCEEPLVSADFNGNSHSSIFDADLTKVLGHRMAKVFAWYDNEWSYACRLADVSAMIARQF